MALAVPQFGRILAWVTPWQFRSKGIIDEIFCKPEGVFASQRRILHYLSIAGLSGDLEVRDIDIGFGDIIKDSHMATAGHVEATNNKNWPFLFDINYLNLSDCPNILIIRLKNALAL